MLSRCEYKTKHVVKVIQNYVLRFQNGIVLEYMRLHTNDLLTKMYNVILLKIVCLHSKAAHYPYITSLLTLKLIRKIH